jgi:hypothetical protein
MCSKTLHSLVLWLVRCPDAWYCLPACRTAPVLSLNFDTQAALAEDPAQSAIREITLGLDVPQVDRSERAYDRMREAAQALARAMDGVVTDSNGMPLIGETMDVFALELEGMYNTLDERELSAGSALARRLFS